MGLDDPGDRPAQRQLMHRQNPTTTVNAVSVRVRLDITGVVQGVGFRPAVARIAAEFALGGWVYNDAGSVHCEFEGPAADVDAAVSALQDRPPPMARIDTLAVTAVQTRGRRADSPSSPVGPVMTAAPWCRRISRSVRTACGRCATLPTAGTGTRSSPAPTAGRATPSSPICPMTGRPPRWRASRCASLLCGVRTIRPTAAITPRPSRARTAGLGCRGSIEDAADALLAGRVVAIKGIGGYHLACRADDDAVGRHRLRDAKEPARQAFCGDGGRSRSGAVDRRRR